MILVRTETHAGIAALGRWPTRSPANRRAKTRAAAEKARRIAAWVARTEAGIWREQDDPDTQDLFVALQACAYQTRRSPRGKRVTPAERNEWAERWRTIRNHLITENVGLAYTMVARFRGHSVDRDDLLGEAMLALLRAVEGFDPCRGCRFSTYACNAIVRSLIQAVKKSNRSGRLRFVGETNILDERLRELEDTQNAWSDLFADRLRRALDVNQGDLTEREHTVLAERFPMRGESRRTLAQIGNRLGLSKERVRQIQSVALAKLRDVLQADPVLQ